MFIRSERLFLRPGWPEDQDELVSQMADEHVVRHLARAPWPYTADDARSFLAQSQDSRLPHFLITRPHGGGSELIGGVGLSGHRGEVNLGYWIGRQHWGQGFAREAASALLRLAETLGHGRIVAHHFIDNPASGRVLKAVGFRPTGRTMPLFSAGRGESAPGRECAIELGGCGGLGDDDKSGMRRKAA